MTYRPDRQRRVQIIRGRGKESLDTILMPMAEAALLCTPATKDGFREAMNGELEELFPVVSEKTIDNYRTEIVHQLFGLVCFSDDAVVISQRATRLIESGDQTAFFKELTYRFQFPFPGASRRTWEETRDLKLKPGPFIVSLLKQAETLGTYLTKDEIKYYVLNAEDVLLGHATTGEVLSAILKERKGVRSFGFPISSGSWASQHLNEFVGYLELSGLIQLENMGGEQEVVCLNPKEQRSINRFWNYDAIAEMFDPSGFSDHEEMQAAWDVYSTSLPAEVLQDFGIVFESSDDPESTSHVISISGGGYLGGADIELGRRGELWALEFERLRVGRFAGHLVRKIRDRANERNIGYDIQSARANYQDDLHDADEFIYIEVKSTRRVVPPLDANGPIKMTRNEWIKAKESRTSFYIYRVYFLPNEVRLFVMNDPYGQDGQGVFATPTEYSVTLQDAVGEWH